MFSHSLTHSALLGNVMFLESHVYSDCPAIYPNEINWYGYKEKSMDKEITW